MTPNDTNVIMTIMARKRNKKITRFHSEWMFNGESILFHEIMELPNDVIREFESLSRSGARIKDVRRSDLKHPKYSKTIVRKYQTVKRLKPEEKPIAPQKQKNIDYHTLMNLRAAELERNLPKSEQWFRSLYTQHKHEKDEYNRPFKGKIPDIINHQFKYIVEVDGSIHDTAKQIIIDRNKDIIFKKAGYQVFRVIAYDQFSFNECLSEIKQIRGDIIKNNL